jgi:hypothetical protein
VIAKLMANPVAVILSTEFAKGETVHFDTAVITCLPSAEPPEVRQEQTDLRLITCGLGPLAKYPDTICHWTVFARILGRKPQEPLCKVQRFIPFTVKFDPREAALQRNDFLA